MLLTPMMHAAGRYLTQQASIPGALLGVLIGVLIKRSFPNFARKLSGSEVI